MFKKPGTVLGLLMLVAAVSAGVVCHGPFFGLMEGAVLGLPAALIAEAAWKASVRSGRSPHGTKCAVVWGVAIAVPAVVVYMLCRPPGGAAIVREHLGLDPREIRDLRTWTDTWGRDPIYAVRFLADTHTLERAAEYMNPVADVGPASRPTRPSMWWPRPCMPEWWTPDQAGDTYRGYERSSEPTLWLRFDPRTGEAYFMVIYH